MSTLKDDEIARLRSKHTDLPDKPYPCITCGAKDPEDEATYVGIDGKPHVCDCIGQYKLQRYLLHSGLQDKYQRFTWADATSIHEAALKAAIDYHDNYAAYAKRGLGLILWGQELGTGKTLLATLLFKKLLASCFDGYFVQFADMLSLYTQTWRDDEERRWFDKRLRNAGVLVIDDVGREGSARMSVAESAFEGIIRGRVQANKPTIITTNWDVAVLEKAYTRQLGSLLSESCMYVEVRGNLPTEGRTRRQQVNMATQREALEDRVRPITLA